MTMPNARSPVEPGEPAPDFTLPAAHHEGSVSLADYRGQRPVLLALFRGLYCAFCRRHVVQLGSVAQKLQEVGVEALGVMATAPERARLYFRYRPPRLPMGADPDLMTHRAYGLPRSALTPEMFDVAQLAAARELRRLNQEVPAADPYGALSRLDRFEHTEIDEADFQRHQAQLTGQFLVDREGIVRWANIECAREGPAGFGDMPSDEELLAAARAL
ncbi:MAG: redoxin domain-containing protein [Candidatus Rokuibacteriota bacterium]